MGLIRKHVLILLLMALISSLAVGQIKVRITKKGVGKTEVTEEKSATRLKEILDPMREGSGVVGQQGTITSVTRIDLLEGTFTNDDWISLLTGARDRFGVPVGVKYLSVFNQQDGKSSMDNMGDVYYPHAVGHALSEFVSLSLKRVSCSLFYNSAVVKCDLPKVEEIGYAGFMAAARMAELRLPSLKIAKGAAFRRMQNLRFLSTPMLQTLSQDDKTEALMDLITNSPKTAIREPGKTFEDCHKFSEWELGEAFDPTNINDTHFKALSKSRHIIFVELIPGTQNTRPIKSDDPRYGKLVEKFKKSKGWDNSTNLWHGWEIYNDKTFYPINTTVSGIGSGTTCPGVSTEPHGHAKAGSKVKIFHNPPPINGSLRLEYVNMVWKENGVVKTKKIVLEDGKDAYIDMPAAEITLDAYYQQGNLTASYEYIHLQTKELVKGEQKQDQSLWGITEQYRKEGLGDNRTDVKKVEIHKGNMTVASWSYVAAYHAMREFILHKEVGPVEAIPDLHYHVFWTYLFHQQIRKVKMHNVKHVPRNLISERYYLESLLLPDVQRFSDRALARLPKKYNVPQDYSQSIVLGVPAKKVPEATKESFIEMFDVPGSRGYLMVLDENGEEVKNDAERRAALDLYRNDPQDGNTSDNMWFCWRLDALRVKIDPEARTKGNVSIITPSEGASWEHANVSIEVIPHLGKAVEKVYYVVEGSSEQHAVTVGASGYYEFVMPNKDVTVYVKYTERTHNVDVEVRKVKVGISSTAEALEHGSAEVSPRVGVTPGAEITVTLTPDAGFELNEGAKPDLDPHFYYQEILNGQPTGPKVRIKNKKEENKYTFQMPDASVKVFVEYKALLWDITACANLNGGKLVFNSKAYTTEEVVVSPRSNPGYRLEKLIYNDGAEHDITADRYFVMPAKNVELCAIFKQINASDIIINTRAEPALAGTIKPSKDADLTENEKVTFEITSKCGYKFLENTLMYCQYGAQYEGNPQNWKPISKNADGKFELTMPKYSVTVRGEFAAEKQGITLPYDNGMHAESGCSIRVSEPTSPDEYVTGKEIRLTTEIIKGWRIVEPRYRLAANPEPYTWYPLNEKDLRFTMPCGAIVVDAVFERLGFQVVVLGTEGGSVTATPYENVPEGKTIEVQIESEDGYSLLADNMGNSVLRSVWWSPSPDAADPEKRKNLKEDEGKFRILIRGGVFSFKMPQESMITDGKVWVWADFTNQGYKVEFVGIDPIEGKNRGTLKANSFANVHPGFQVVVDYAPDVTNSAWALDKSKVEYILAEMVDGKLVPKQGAEWIHASGASFTMPESHVIVRGTLYPTGNSVYPDPNLVGGTISATPWANVEENKEVRVVATPEEGYELDPASISYREVGATAIDHPALGGVFRMPNSNVYVSCTFRAIQYTVTAAQCDGGLLIPSPGKLEKGKIVTVPYQRFPGWDIVKGSMEWAKEGTDEWFKVEDGRFEMPAANVVVRAQFTRQGAERFELTLVVEGEGSLTVLNGEEELASGMEIESGTVLTIRREAAEGWVPTELEINSAPYTEETFTVSSTTVIKAVFMQNKITAVQDERVATIFPNPFHDVLRVRTENAVSLELYTVSGQLVHRGAYGDGTMRLNGLQSGVYLLRIRYADGHTATRRVIKR